MMLVDEVEGLRKTFKEGVYWDFKQQHHANITDLLHDILCLANAQHDGDRYLIFGIEDGSMDVHDLGADNNRRTQANIISFLIDNQYKFAGGNYPDLRLEKIVIEACEIDVLVIARSTQRPFYLVEKIDGVRPHHICARTGDTNTPIYKSASPQQIERMWRARFGLDKSPLERIKTYLADFDNWQFDTQDSGDGIWWHTTFPEFTISIDESSFVCTQEWTRGEIVKDRNFSSLYSIFYHQTRLARVHWVSFDDHKKNMVAPKWEACSTGRLYYYERGRLELAMQIFHAHHNRADHSKRLRNPTGHLAIPVASKDEIEHFLDTQCPHKVHEVCRDPSLQYQLFLKNQIAFQKWQVSSAAAT